MVRLVPGIEVTGTGTLFVAALVLGFLNAVLRPVIAFLALPVALLTLGLFTLVVNGIVFALAARLVSGFAVADFGSAILGALVLSVVSFVLSIIVKPME